ncbi:ABC transporter ATP-binding protein [Polynucleobacter sp. SHI8]|uniref:ABC transporter ATP-binding protein n=1 Tax=unclassified Polynucleobacter TaxID=2640945 RepID=UPI00249313B9|nr:MULTISPECIES: ATP-binding cassette domain-containing protein [unclassified Polynucleobacter]BDW11096.1 ABC transporter ATP-binding protein [Polynucleobacter sp. SHI2]BDW13542.1 ABC transporter ATP-binding protein [Polynucleobacter sp. SHI8]
MLNNPLVEVKHLQKTVSAHSGLLKILSDINFAIYTKETIAILGASGSGKSSLLSIMAGLDPEYEGSVCLFGQELKDLNEDQRSALRKNDVGFVFQSFLLIPELSAFQNICLPLEISGQINPQSIDFAKSLLERIGLSDRANHYPATMSGGEQQRIALARAFISKPKILFLDEPTGSLDTENGQRVIGLLFELNQDFGTTIVMVTHDMEVSQQCDRVLTLKAGCLV